MSVTITIEQAQATLKNLIEQLAPGAEIVITDNEPPVAKLVSAPAKKRQRRKAGNCAGMIRIVADDDESNSGTEPQLA